MPPLRFHILPSSGVPIYRQVVDQVRSAVAGEAGAGRSAAFGAAGGGGAPGQSHDHLQGVCAAATGGCGGDGTRRGVRVIEPQTVGTRRQRREAIEPLLRQVATTAFQLGLSAEEVLALLEPLLEEFQRERAGDATAGRC